MNERFPGCMRLPAWAAALILAAAILAVYLPVGKHEFLYFDDNVYIFQNPRVLDGLTWRSFVWAFENVGLTGNWHPLTWLSHMLDIQLFGLDSGAHHLVSLALHAAASVALFLALGLATGAFWRSFLVAALFALHPLHVESVAWAAERKDVLSGFIFMLTMLAYVLYTRKPSVARYAAVAVLTALGLMAKAMLVTLPFVLLLLDVWPLRRFSRGAVARLLLEKAPLLVLSAGTAWLAYVAQSRAGAVAVLDTESTALPVANAVTSATAYLLRAAWPRHLTIFYPLPLDGIPAWKVLSSLGVLASVSALAVLQARRRPWLAAGWCWYLGMLVPVIGLVQVGGQASADRYTYLPLVGVFIMAAWAWGELAERLPRGRIAAALAAGIVLTAYAFLAGRQVGYWKDGVTLFSRAVAVTEMNWSAENALGLALMKRGDLDGAVSHFRESVRIRLSFGEGHSNLSAALASQGKLNEAAAEISLALKISPRKSDLHYNYACLLTTLGRISEAETEYRQTISLDPLNSDAYVNLGDLLYRQRRLEEAASFFSRAIEVNPRDSLAWANLGVVHWAAGRLGEAGNSFRNALRIDPGNASARAGLERLPGRAAGAPARYP